MGADPPETGDRAGSGEILGRLGGAGSIPGLGDFLPDFPTFAMGERGGQEGDCREGRKGWSPPPAYGARSGGIPN